MQHFRTPIAKPIFDFDINHKDQILCIGSCFAENVAQKLQNNKFSTLLNPFGILYNPISIVKTLNLLLQEKQFPEDLLFENHGLWHSFDHHGHFSNPDKTNTLKKINDELSRGRAFLKTTNRLIITFGTANVFVFKESGEIVANCHKLPGSEFDRKRLFVEVIIEKLFPIFNKLKKQLPDLQIITTVSPIRHVRDGLVENQKSKAVLLLALDKLCADLDFAHYFPSYEIMLDDLRDYRFYEADLIHPNTVAIEYIWNIFKQAFFKKETTDLNVEIEKIIVASQHRPFHAESNQHQSFLKQQIEKIEKLIEKHSFLDFKKEVAIFEKQLSK